MAAKAGYLGPTSSPITAKTAESSKSYFMHWWCNFLLKVFCLLLLDQGHIHISHDIDFSLGLVAGPLAVGEVMIIFSELLTIFSSRVLLVLTGV